MRARLPLKLTLGGHSHRYGAVLWIVQAHRLQYRVCNHIHANRMQYVPTLRALSCTGDLWKRVHMTVPVSRNERPCAGRLEPLYSSDSVSIRDN
jgi:hypothetical protein